MIALAQRLSCITRCLPRPSGQSMWTMWGNGQREEIRLFKGVYLYARTTQQKWSPAMTEHERERGIRIGHRRFGMTETVCEFHDGKEPRIKRGRF